MIESIFILVLLVLCNYTGNTLPTKLVDMIQNNLIIKHTILFLLIYYSIKEWGETRNTDLKYKLKVTLGLWVGYLLVIKCEMPVVLTVFALLCWLFFVDDIKEYIENHYEGDKKQNRLFLLNTMYDTSVILLLCIIIYGIATTKYRFKHSRLIDNVLDSHK